MKNKKKLTINAALCDMTRLSAEVLDAYEAITINAGSIVVSARVKELISRIPVAMNAAQILQAEEGTQVSIKNGKAEITGSEAPAMPTMLIVNGQLIIHPDSAEALKGYVNITVNGKMIFPKSLGQHLSMAQVNGLSLSYPDDAILIDSALKVDEMFILRAKSSHYYVMGDVTLIDENLDIKALSDKGTQFTVRRAFIAQKLLKEALPLFDDKARITPIPEGYAFVEGENTLSSHLISSKGTRLFFPKKLAIPRDQEEALRKLSGLHVEGGIKLPESLLDALMALKPQYQKLLLYKGLLIIDKSNMTVSQALLDQNPEGLTIEDCGAVTLEECISAQTILDKLIIRDCGAVLCQADQEGALLQVTSDVGTVSVINPREDTQPREKEDPLHETINTAHYQF